MLTVQSLQNQIIDLISRISNLSQLTEIHAEVKAKIDVKSENKKAELPWHNLIVEPKETITFDDLIKEQGKKSLNYNELRGLADELEWEHSLDEMLAILD